LLDYAYGGAVVNQSASNNGPPSLMGQINDYLIFNHFNLQAVADNTQYILWGGANDIADAPLSNETLTAQGVTGNLAELAVGLPLLITSQVQKLISSGAINVLIMLLPSWSYAPEISGSFTSSELGILSQFTDLVNQGIKSNVSSLARPGVNLQFFDVVGFTNEILNDPAAFGIVNTTAPCLENFEVFFNGTGGEAPIVCSNPDQFLFWDGVHPTTTVHAIYANAVMNAIGWQQ
jgi:phospholipase/lecithinase/hemolysin